MQPQNNSSTVQNRWKQAGGISSAYLSLITCLDNQLERARHRHKLLHWVTQSAYMFAPLIFFSTHQAPLFQRRGSWAPREGGPQPPPCQPTPGRPAALRVPGKTASSGGQPVRLRLVMQAGSPRDEVPRFELRKTEATSRFPAIQPIIQHQVQFWVCEETSESPKGRYKSSNP